MVEVTNDVMTRGTADNLARRIMRRLAEAAAVLAIFLLLLEAVGRLADPLGISYYPETAKYLDTMIIEEPIGYRNRPNLKGQFWGAPVTINSLGLRDREVSLEPADNEFRILLLGNSGAFGLGVADEDTYSSRLEQQLNRDADGMTYRVINMGVPSYNTEQELIQLQSLGLSLDPDLVLLMFASTIFNLKCGYSNGGSRCSPTSHSAAMRRRCWRSSIGNFAFG